MVFFLFSERVAPLVAGLGRGNIVKAAGGVNRAAGCGVVLFIGMGKWLMMRGGFFNFIFLRRLYVF
jgi:3-oxoacyl-[acyl-carrier-protein] reductase